MGILIRLVLVVVLVVVMEMVSVQGTLATDPCHACQLLSVRLAEEAVYSPAEESWHPGDLRKLCTLGAVENVNTRLRDEGSSDAWTRAECNLLFTDAFRDHVEKMAAGDLADCANAFVRLIRQDPAVMCDRFCSPSTMPTTPEPLPSESTLAPPSEEVLQEVYAS